jgi:molybdate transport repressor ModE-like protein
LQTHHLRVSPTKNRKMNEPADLVSVAGGSRQRFRNDSHDRARSRSGSRGSSGGRHYIVVPSRRKPAPRAEASPSAEGGSWFYKKGERGGIQTLRSDRRGLSNGRNPSLNAHRFGLRRTDRSREDCTFGSDHKTGSITAATRSINMSYRRAWLLVDDLSEPAVTAKTGGAGGGHAIVTPVGQKIIQHYHSIARSEFQALRPAVCPGVAVFGREHVRE